MDVGNAKDGDVNLPEICYPEVQDPITQLYNDIIDFRDATSNQLKDRAILPVINDISLALNNQVLGVLPRDEVNLALEKISDYP